jgi:hypothetical protein
MDKKMGEWAFIIGVIIAIVVGIAAGLAPGALASTLPLLLAVLAILGVIVGFLNISEKELNSFLIAAIALLVSAKGLEVFNGLATLPQIGTYVSPLLTMVLGIVGAISIFVAPATVILALKSIYNLGSK